jgi:hypothetical protein
MRRVIQLQVACDVGVRMNGPWRRCWGLYQSSKGARLPTSLCCAWQSWAADKLLERLPRDRDAVRFAGLTSLKPGLGDDANDTDDTAIMRHGTAPTANVGVLLEAERARTG